MTVRPSPPMRDFEVSAILREAAEPGSGKSQFRRVLKPQPYVARHCTVCGLGMGEWSACDAPVCGDLGPGVPIVKTLPFAIGDLLWCREAWKPHSLYAELPPRLIPQTKVFFAADGGYSPSNTPWRSSTQMPRWASRLTLEVVGVKIERLQSISEEDALAEGVENDVWDMAPVARRYGVKDGWFVGWSLGINEPLVSVEDDEVCRRSFETMWETIHGRGSWSANPFVAAVQFRPHLANVDLLRQRTHGES